MYGIVESRLHQAQMEINSPIWSEIWAYFNIQWFIFGPCFNLLPRYMEIGLVNTFCAILLTGTQTAPKRMLIKSIVKLQTLI